MLTGLGDTEGWLKRLLRGLRFFGGLSLWWCWGGAGSPNKQPLPHASLISLAFLALSLSLIPSCLMRRWLPSWLPLTPLFSPFPFTSTLLIRILSLSGNPTSGASGQTPADPAPMTHPLGCSPDSLSCCHSSAHKWRLFAAQERSVYFLSAGSSTGNGTWLVPCECHRRTWSVERTSQQRSWSAREMFPALFLCQAVVNFILKHGNAVPTGGCGVMRSPSQSPWHKPQSRHNLPPFLGHPSSLVLLSLPVDTKQHGVDASTPGSLG